jgi:hypothetical protein
MNQSLSTIEKEIAWFGNEWSEAPRKVILRFTAEDAHRIATSMSMISDYKEKLGLNSMRIEPCDYTLLNSEDEPEEEWRDEDGEFIVYENSFCFYSQSKWDSSDQIEQSKLTLTKSWPGLKKLRKLLQNKN